MSLSATEASTGCQKVRGHRISICQELEDSSMTAACHSSKSLIVLPQEDYMDPPFLTHSCTGKAQKESRAIKKSAISNLCTEIVG